MTNTNLLHYAFPILIRRTIRLLQAQGVAQVAYQITMTHDHTPKEKEALRFLVELLDFIAENWLHADISDVVKALEKRECCGHKNCCPNNPNRK